MNPLGTNPQIETASGATLSNSFNTMPVNDINSIIASNSVKSTQVGSGINSSAQQIRNSDGSYMIVGINSATNKMGVFFYDANGNLIADQTGRSYTTYDSNQKKIVQLGAQDDGSVNLKFFDANGVGLAQFGRFPDNSIALKVAKGGVEVSTATNDQLIFNSGQDIFKIARIVTGDIILAFNSFTQGSGGPGGFNQSATLTLSMAHNLGIVPALAPQIYNSFAGTYEPIGSQSMVSFGTTSGANPMVISNSFGLAGIAIAKWHIWADTTNVYVSGYRDGYVLASDTIPSVTFPDASFKIFCLQETATSS